MNVSCTSCSAKYAVPDEKVRGKKVKITCKHCGTGIIVDGTKLDASAEAAAAAAPAPAAPDSPAAPKPAALAPSPAVAAAKPAEPKDELRFDIAYPDDRQETLAVSEIVEKYAAGTLDDEAFIWREGMTDWKAPFDIPELASALGARGLKKKAPAAAVAPAPVAPAPVAAAAAPLGFDDDEATRIQLPFDPREMDDAVAGVWREPAKEAPSSPEAAFSLTSRASSPPALDDGAAASPKPAATSPKPAAAPAPAAASLKPAATATAPAPAETAKPSAARRAAARGGGDLFGDLAAAGSESDESLGTEAKDGPKMTGARNESSVLFSLDALVKQEKPAAKKLAPRDDAAAILLGADSSPNSMASIGTGHFGSAFAAPDFTAPVTAAPVAETRASDPVEISAAGAPKKKGGAGLWIGLGVVLLAAGGAVAAGLPAKLMGTPPPAPSASPAAAKPEPVPAPAPQAPTPAAEPSAEASATPATAPASGGAAATPPVGGGGAAVAKPADPAKPAEAKPAEARPAEAKPAEAKPAEAPAGDAAPFDRSAAVAALTSAAGNVQSCKTADGPTGSGKVSITFMPSGRATNTQVSGDLAGTAVGGCVARIFRSAKVPPFSGDAVTVSKSFSVQ